MNLDWDKRSQSKLAILGTTALVTFNSAGISWADTTTNWTNFSTPVGATYDSNIPEGAERDTPFTYWLGATGTVVDPNDNSPVNVTVSGEIAEVSCFTNSGCQGQYVTPPVTSDFTTYVGSGTTASTDFLAQTGYVQSGQSTAHTVTFDRAVDNVVMSIWSLGDVNSISELNFTNDFQILSYSSDADPSAAGGSDVGLRATGDATTGYKLQGYEGDGYIAFVGPVTTISWQVTQPELYSAFNFGLSTNPYSTEPRGAVYAFEDNTLPPIYQPYRDIDENGDQLSDLVALNGSVLNSVFDGGELVIDRNLSASGTGSIATFKIRDTTGRGRLNVGSTNSYTVESAFENFDGSTTGGLEKVGTGTLRLTADSTYTGATVVSAGMLDLAGSLTSDITVASVGTVKGYGSTSGGLTSSGTVSPGSSPGTLSVEGPVVFKSTNNFVVELDGLSYDSTGGAGTYDRLAVTGTDSTDTFTAGGTLTAILSGISEPANNDLVPVIGDAFRVVTTGYATGVSGAFTSIADPDYTNTSTRMPTNTRFDVLYGGNYVDLVLTPDDLGTFARAYGIQNMVNAAEALDTVRPAQGTNSTSDKDQFFNGLYDLTATQIAQALLQASGEIHAFALSDARDGWQSGVGVVRSASQDADRNYWLDVSGYDVSVDQDSTASSYDGTTRRLWVGTDIYQAGAYVLGVSVGVSNSDITTADTGSAETKTTSLALYMNGSQGSFEYDGILSVNRSEIDTTRTVDLRTGALTNTSSSTTRGAALTAQVGHRYDIKAAALSSLVWLRGDIGTTKADGFVEDGSSVTALTVAEQDMRSADVSLGYTISGEIPNNEQAAGTWNLGIGASKTIDRSMPYVSRTMSLHGATWDVSVPQSGDVAKFASAGIDLPIREDANLWLNIVASERDGSLAKSAAFGFQVQW